MAETVLRTIFQNENFINKLLNLIIIDSFFNFKLKNLFFYKTLVLENCSLMVSAINEFIFEHWIQSICKEYFP